MTLDLHLPNYQIDNEQAIFCQLPRGFKKTFKGN